MVHLNKHPKFFWVTKVNKEGFAKANIDHESFWIRKCQPSQFKGENGFIGIIDNYLLNPCSRLDYNDEVFFIPILMDLD